MMKDMWWHEKAKQIQVCADKRDMKALYGHLCTIYALSVPLLAKNKKTFCISWMRSTIKWWERFSEVLNHQLVVNIDVIAGLEQAFVIHRPHLPLTPCVVEVIVSLVNTEKTPDRDGIVAELLRKLEKRFWNCFLSLSKECGL